MMALAHALRLARKVHHIHHAKHKHVVVGHAMEIAAGLSSALRWGEALAGGFALVGAAILFVGLFLTDE